MDLTLFHDNGTVQVGREGDFEDELAKEPSYYLFDASEDARLVYFYSPIKCRVIISASPSKDVTKEWSDHSSNFYMPLWSYPELEAVRVLCPPHIAPDELNVRYEMWGGTCRWTAATQDSEGVRSEW